MKRVNIINKIYTTLKRWYIFQLCVSQKKDNTPNTEINKNKEKFGRFEKIILKFKKMKILRALGFKDFLKYNEIIDVLKEDDSNQKFSKIQSLIFIKNEFDRLWMIGSDTHIYFIFDNGHRIEILEKRPKNKDVENSFTVKEGEDYAKIIFNDTNTEIPYNLSYTGGTNHVIETFKKFNNE